ncbi:hypothetical protein GF360_01225 [candidate division WWE3 bacterium]|nr:hypothetical protein [candidate division WWE3 bacterium]
MDEKNLPTNSESENPRSFEEAPAPVEDSTEKTPDPESLLEAMKLSGGNSTNTGISPDTKSKIIKLVIVLIATALGSVFAIDLLFTDYEPSSPIDTPVEETTNSYLEGYVKYVPPFDAPSEDISYKLVDPQGKTRTYLKSEDARLEVAENLLVRVSGLRTKTESGEDVLIVSELVVSN